MHWVVHTLLVIYLLISSAAVFYRVYKSYLQYFSPVKGYVASFLLIFGLLSIDAVIYSYTRQKAEMLNVAQFQDGENRILKASFE